MSLSVEEDKSLVILSCWRQEGEASVFGVVHGKGQPVILDIVVNVNLKENFGSDASVWLTV